MASDCSKAAVGVASEWHRNYTGAHMLGTTPVEVGSQHPEPAGR